MLAGWVRSNLHWLFYWDLHQHTQFMCGFCFTDTCLIHVSDTCNLSDYACQHQFSQQSDLSCGTMWDDKCLGEIHVWRCCPVRKRTSWTRGWWQSMGTVTLATITEAIWMVTRLTPRLGWVSPSASSTSYKKSFVIIESVMTIRDILMTYCLFTLIVRVHVQYHWDWNWTIFISQVWLTAEHEYVK